MIDRGEIDPAGIAAAIRAAPREFKQVGEEDGGGIRVPARFIDVLDQRGFDLRPYRFCGVVANGGQGRHARCRGKKLLSSHVSPC